MKRLSLLCAIIIFLTPALIAQSMQNDSIKLKLAGMNIRYGVLPNGLTYYLHQNDEADKVFLNLIVKAGNGHQDDDQIEIAHLLEHMGFVKTKHFENPWEYFLSNGLIIGNDINASTNMDYTDYFLILPSQDKRLIRNGFLWLSDCAQGIVLDETKANSEKDVVIEELRRSDNYAQNLGDQVGHSAKAGDLLGWHDRITRIQHYEFSRLLDFYKEWYRPDLQAVIVSGKINVDSAEHHIKSFFSELKTPGTKVRNKVSPVQYRPVPTFNVFVDNDSKNVEFRFMTVYPYFRSDYHKAIRCKVLEEISVEIMQNRLRELRSSGKREFVFDRLYSYTRGDLDNPVGITTIRTSIDSVRNQFQAAVTEIESLVRHGVTDKELAVARQSYLNTYKNEHVSSWQTVRNDMRALFLYNTPSHGEAEAKEVRSTVSNVAQTDILDVLKSWIDPEHQHVAVIAPESVRQNLPDSQILKSWILEARAKSILPYVPVVRDTVVKPLVTSQELVAIRVGETKVKETVLKEIGATRLTMLNGIQVILKPVNTPNSRNNIQLRALSLNDTHQLSHKDILSLKYVMATISQSGLGKLNAEELGRFLQDKNAQVLLDIETSHPAISGQCGSGELETMLQLVTQYFVSPKVNEIIFNELLTTSKRNETKTSLDPESEFNNMIKDASASLNPIVWAQDRKNITYQEAVSLYKKYFSNPGKFVFVIAGDFEVDNVKVLVAKYLNSLTVTEKGNAKSSNKSKITMNTRLENKIIYGAKENKASVFLHMRETCNYSAKNIMRVDALKKALQSVLYTRLRGVEGEVYAIYAGGRIAEYYNKCNFFVQYSCDPKKVEKTIVHVEEEMEKLLTQGASIELCKEIQVRQKEELKNKLTEPAFWSHYISNQVVYKKNMTEFEQYDGWIEEIEPELIKELAINYLDLSKMRKFVLMPGEPKK